MTTLGEVRSELDARPPRVRDPADFEQHASVAMLLVPSRDDLDLLFIRRREHPSDPWSGHTAFPGGRRDAEDEDTRASAVRETQEEVGVDLQAASSLGRLDDLAGKSSSLVVSCFVYGMESAPALDPNYEVAAVRFMSLADVESPAHHAVSGFEYLGQSLMLPAIQVFDPPATPLWGLTYRFLELFMQALSRPIPPMPWDEAL